jgi:hypothetical protein
LFFLSLFTFLFSFNVNNGFCLVAFLWSFPLDIVLLLFSGMGDACERHRQEQKETARLLSLFVSFGLTNGAR